MEKRRLPIGTENFEKLREKNLYYVDKTGLIKKFFGNFSEVTLFTRPRRFGKSLNMSMLRYFFEIGTEKRLFDGLAISKEKELCEQHMGQYPVISISLKGVEGMDFEAAKRRIWSMINNEAIKVAYLLDSDKLIEAEKKNFQSLCDGTYPLEDSFKFLSELLYKHHGKKTVILIDEYDVPLDKAYIRGYYDQMIHLIRQMFQSVLKTNDALEFAILTGCLRISKESIFTGLNNLSVNTIIDPHYNEWFGFTEAEVHDMLDYYGFSEHYDITKEWYNGYRFGQTKVYCPWDVINWCYYLQSDEKSRPQNFWVNTSSNDLIVHFAEKSSSETRKQVEDLLEGKTVFKKIKLDLTYPEIDDDPENLWSVLFTTGYLTWNGMNEAGEYELSIPNREVHSIFKEKINQWFSDKIKSDTEGLEEFYRALRVGDAKSIQAYINDLIFGSISYMDGGTSCINKKASNTESELANKKVLNKELGLLKKEEKNKNLKQKEIFYHGMLLGLLRTNYAWKVVSNREAGEGRADLIAEPIKKRKDNFGIIIEIKVAKSYDQMEEKSQEALEQITRQNYDAYFVYDNPDEILHYGVAFCKKRCVVVKG